MVVMDEKGNEKNGPMHKEQSNPTQISITEGSTRAVPNVTTPTKPGIRAMAFSNQMALNNFKVLHDQERHQRDYQAGLPYAEHSGWTNYPNLPHPQGSSDPTPHWPEAVGSSFVPMPYQPPPQQESSPLDNYRDMFEALTGYPYQPNPPVNPNERYQR
ncbi:hypothetical protein Hdeb2414_s0010g00343191 [Helianthus debilis subsp. tardiflorus]